MTEPGCFGVPSIFSFRSNICGSCCHASKCQRASYVALLSYPNRSKIQELIRQHEAHCDHGDIDVEPVKTSVAVPDRKVARKTVRFELSNEQRELIGSMPKNAGIALKKLMQRGIDKIAFAAFRRRENPFDTEGTRSYRVAFDQLMADDLTRSKLQAALMQQFGWAESSARSEVSLIFAVFPALGIAKSWGCRLQPVRE